MAENYYGGQQVPSSRPPEPPFRAGSQAQPTEAAHTQPVPLEPDTSGIDATVEVPFGQSTGTPIAGEATESFNSARSGDTGKMPATQQAADVLWTSKPAAGQSAGEPAADAASAAAPAAAAAPAKKHAAEKAPKKSGAGKTFLFGFLGAALACALAIGGFAAWNAYGSANKPAAGAGDAATVMLGTTDTSVINAVEEGQTLAEAVAAKALPSVVAVYNYQKQSNAYSYGYGFGYGYGDSGNSDEPVATGMGSGVVISNDGYIITNYHVVEGADKLTITVDGVERDAEYVGGDSSSDIAVLKVNDTEGLVAADVGDSDSLRIGEWVMTVGAPLGLEQSVATGVVSATNRSTIMDSSSSTDMYGMSYSSGTPEYTYYPNMIQTDAVINPGNSGGALVDADGKLIGINAMLSSYSGTYAGVGFAIPVNYAMGLAQDIIAGKEPTHAALGVTISQVNSRIAQRYNLSTDTGAYISSIVSGSGAANSGLQIGDIITAINGKPVTSTTDVTLDVREHQVGDTVTVTVNREGESIDVEVVLSSDADLVYSTDESNSSSAPSPNGNDGQNGQNGNSNPWGGNGRDNGYGNQYNEEDLRELLELMEMMGM